MLFLLLGGLAGAPSGERPRAGTTGPRPAGDPATWIVPDDYPPAALRALTAGTTRFRLAIDANGRVAGCTVTQSSGDADLDATTCTLPTRRATFTPARDRKGHALAASYSSAVIWQIPAGAPDPSQCHVVPAGTPGDIAVTGVPTCP